MITSDPYNNVTDNIFQKMGVKLHQNPNHPLGILKKAISDYFDARFGAGTFEMLDDLYPIVSTKQNFDQVLVPEDHVSRSPNDTYYVDTTTVLRCHTSAHQVRLGVSRGSELRHSSGSEAAAAVRQRSCGAGLLLSSDFLALDCPFLSLLPPSSVSHF